MESANFIPLGSVKERLPFDQPEKPEKPPKVFGTTKEERKRIAREVRLAARREKKKIKSDAKKQRKQNAILHRRMTRNNEKYSKNKERNRQREIDLERSKIRNDAVRQAERLAAKYDPSGKTFNVGEVIVLKDGTVRSKERLQKTEELKTQRENEKKAAAEAKQEALELKQARRAAKRSGADPDTAMEGINPERLAQMLPGNHISNTQKKKQALYAPKPVPPKPVIPEGISLAEGEENMIALWDITDEEIVKRLNEVKKKKGQERAAFKKQQQKEKIFRRAMKIKKKQAINRGEDFDPEKAAEEILKEQKKAKSKSDREHTTDSESDWDSDSDSDSSSDSDSNSGSGSEVETKETQPKSEAAEDMSLSRKRSISEAMNGDEAASKEPKAKKTKKSKDPSSEVAKSDQPNVTAKTNDASTKEKNKEVKSLSTSTSDRHPTPAAIKKIVQKEKVRVKKDKKRKEKQVKVVEEAEKLQTKPKKRKRSKEQEEADPAEEARPEKTHKKKKAKVEEPSAAPAEEARPEKSHKKKKAKVEEPAAAPAGNTNGAEQWNPDALTGDEARKAKFLRLLGAGKSDGAISSSKHKSQADSAAISKVQSDLERQYDAGMRLKHDGGSKRRGIGA